jgi:hypothetical protein
VAALLISPEDVKELWRFADEEPERRAILLTVLQAEADNRDVTLSRPARGRRSKTPVRPRLAHNLWTVCPILDFQKQQGRAETVRRTTSARSDIAFILVIASLLVQGWTVASAARLLGIGRAGRDQGG